MAIDTPPKQELELDIQEEEPLNNQGMSGPTSEAPYGYKKDGTPAKKRGRPVGYSPGKTGSRPRTRGGSLETQIGAMILTINAPFMLFASSDALDRVEIEALAHAIDQECQRSARFRKYVEQALQVQGGTSLVLVLGAIVGRRVVRHNLIEVPEPIGNDRADAALGGIIAMTVPGNGLPNPNLFVMNDQKSEASA